MSGAYGGGKRLKNWTWTDKDGVRLFVQQGLKPGQYVLETGSHESIDRMVELSPYQTQELIRALGGDPRE
jgi:hypothetical protein